QALPNEPSIVEVTAVLPLCVRRNGTVESREARAVATSPFLSAPSYDHPQPVGKHGPPHGCTGRPCVFFARTDSHGASVHRGTFMLQRPAARCVSAILIATTLSGCFESKRPLHYLGDAELRYYKDKATDVDYAAVHQPPAAEVLATDAPRTL